MLIGARAGGTGDKKKKEKKLTLSGKKIDAIRAKINHTNFICAQCILLEDYSYYSRNEYH